jgi:hypothetical protein
VNMLGNKIQGWRHGLHATEANVSATKNVVSNFHSAAFVIQNSASPANVYGNTAISKNPKDKVLSISGEAGNMNNNELLSEPRP